MDISKDRIKQIIQEEISDIYSTRVYGTREEEDNGDHPEIDDDDYEWASVKAHLRKIHDLSKTIDDRMTDPDDVEEWIQEKVAVISAMLHSINHYQEEEKVRSS
jgi:hypothetical protein